MVAFIDAQRGTYGVEPICAVVPIAPATYFRHKACQAHPDRRCRRARRDAWLRGRLLGPIGNVPPAEFEAQYYRAQDAPVMLAGVN